MNLINKFRLTQPIIIMETMIKGLRDKDAESLRRGIHEGWGHTGENHSYGPHRAKAVSLSNSGFGFPETFKLAYQYADEHDDILALTFSTNLDSKSKFGSGGEIWFHKRLLPEKVHKYCKQILYIK